MMAMVTMAIEIVTRIAWTLVTVVVDLVETLGPRGQTRQGEQDRARELVLEVTGCMNPGVVGVDDAQRNGPRTCRAMRRT